MRLGSLLGKVARGAAEPITNGESAACERSRYALVDVCSPNVAQQGNVELVSDRLRSSSSIAAYPNVKL
jgi:hypothetical protein